MKTLREFISGFTENFCDIEDSRQKSKVDYPLIEILFLSIVAVAGGADSWTSIEAFGKINLNIIRNYYPFVNGAPSDDTIRRVFEILNPDQLNDSLGKYFCNGLDLSEEHLAIDGKTLRGSKYNGTKALHVLNVYASESGLTLFSKEVDNKTNEINVIPEALDLVDIKDAVITIDAMGCQKSIARRILDRGGDYIFGLKGNQIALYNEVESAFSTNAEKFFSMDIASTEDTGHGREEERTCRVIRDLSKFIQTTKWPGIKSVIEVRRKICKKDKITESKNYYISSLDCDANIMMKKIRSHWKIESMHWMLDVVFREDSSTMHKGNIPANMTIIRKFVLNILGSMKGKRDTRPQLIKMIGWSQEYLQKFIQKLIFCS